MLLQNKGKRLVSPLSNLSSKQSDCPCGYCFNSSEEKSLFTVFKNDYAIAMVPERPRIPGNVVIIPYIYHTDFTSLSKKEFHGLFLCVREATLAVERVYDPDGTNVWCDWGDITGRSYQHLVWEIVPRNDRKEGRKYRYKDIHLCPKWTQAQRAEEATRLREALHHSS
ncbi:hypothetical protein FIU95_16550 [Microbulbifer sp. THAF38]|nr:hypothetical protein FIU95_16550 [Microbulbifer sp. THAF38]